MVRHPDADPYQAPEQFESHGPPDYPGFAEWDDVTPPVWEEAGTPEARMPKALAAKFDSSSKEAEDFIHDPLASLRGSGLATIPDGAYVTTHVINHHRRLDKKIMRVMAIVDDESVGITIHKEDR